MRIKTGTVLGIKAGNPKMVFVFEIDRFFINYLCDDDMLPLWCQTRKNLKKSIQIEKQGKYL